MGENLKTVEGRAVRSKAGLVVGSVIITSMTEEEMEHLEGKFLRVTGYVEKDHPWIVQENAVVHKQGFTMPAMTKVLSVDIVEAR